MNNQEKVVDFYDTLGISPLQGLCASLIEEEFDEWKAEYLQDTKEPQLKELVDLVFTCYGFAESKGWDLDTAFDRVYQNNKGRCIQEDGSVKLREDGKVLKRKDYPKVYLGDLV